MATRSCIGVKLANGKYVGVYCHNDGYPSDMARMLHEHYNSQERAEALVALGDLSRVAPNLTQPEGEAHSFDNAYPDCVIAYHRDRNEAFHRVEGITWSGVVRQYDCRYDYLFEDGTWSVSSGDAEHVPLEQFKVDGEWQDHPAE